MNWIRVAVAIVDDPDIHRLALALGCRVAEAVGLVVCTLCKFPEHAPEGNLTNVPPTLVERWAGWDGERGAYDRALRDLFLNADGVWAAWDKHNGAAMRDVLASRKRASDYRRRQAEEAAHRTANGSPNGTAHGSHLRTDVRTDITTGGRKRPLNGKSDYAPGHVNLPEPPPWCVECGDGVPAHLTGGKRGERMHGDGCSRGPKAVAS